MTINSVGYVGTINDAEWAGLAPRVGSARYGVDGWNDFRVSAAAGTRTVQIAPGSAWGYGVRDTNSAAIALALGAAVSGNRWWMIVAHRDWAAGSTDVRAVDAGATMTIPTRAMSPGVADDQPLALVRVGTGAAIAEVRDLRVVAADGGLQAFDELALQYLTRIGTVARIGNFEWHRLLKTDGTSIWDKRDVTPDTGWVNAATNPAWSFNFCQVRRIGGTVFYRISAARPAGWGVGSNMCTLPAGLRPGVKTYVPSSHSSGTREVLIDTTGAVNVNQLSAGAVGVTITGSFPAA